MFKKITVPVFITGFLLIVPIAQAVDEHHPEESAETSQSSKSTMISPDSTVSQATPNPPNSVKPGMGMMGNPKMMRQMMAGGKMSPGMMQGRSGMMRHDMMRKHQQVLNSLDLLDARMVKIEALLERLLKR